MIARFVVVAGMGAVLTAPLAAQGMQQTPTGPAVGEMAPDFTAPGSNKDGTLKAPVHLADLKGKTVVLAFFPAARTRGCTIEMEKFRDDYATLFNGGKDIMVFGVSTDADTTQASWARDAKFPFQFISDKGDIGAKYGTLVAPAKTEKRYIYVIGPDGKIVHVTKPLNVMAPDQYGAMSDAAKKAAGAQ